MSFHIEVQIEALLELRESYDWYEEQRTGLGDEFLEEVEACYHQLSENPTHFSFINDVYRRIKTDRFPFVLIYEIDDQQVIIYSIRHTKRKPL